MWRQTRQEEVDSLKVDWKRRQPTAAIEYDKKDWSEKSGENAKSKKYEPKKNDWKGKPGDNWKSSKTSGNQKPGSKWNSDEWDDWKSEEGPNWNKSWGGNDDNWHNRGSRRDNDPNRGAESVGRRG